MATYAPRRTALLAGLALGLLGPAQAPAAITLTPNPGAPGFPDIHVVDAPVFGNIAHGFSGTRELRQTFNNPATFDIGEIILGLNLDGTDGTANEGAGEGGMVINLYEVLDVNGADWTAAMPGASPIKTWTIPQTTSIPATDGRLSIAFSGADVFTLPARDTGTEGYGLEIATVDGVTAMGTWHVTPNDGVDRYPSGVFYREDGTVSRTFRDAGLSIFAVGATPPAPGDVTGDGEANLDDFNQISANFRTVVGARTGGDLTGDGLVGFEDFREWKANSAVDVSGAFIPEPTAGVLFSASMLLLTAGRGRRVRQARQGKVGGPRSLRCRFLLCGVLLLAATISVPARAVVTLVADPDWPMGADLGMMTLDPELFNVAQRGIAGTRQLRQSFQTDSTFNVGGIVLGADMNGQAGGLIINFFEVADVNADTWQPLGNPLKTINVPVGEPIPNTTLRLGLDLTGFDTFTLPQRNTGTEGYGIQISNGDETTTVGLLRHSNDGTDNYELGKFYTETGGASGGGSSGRDLGIALITTTETPPLPGDVEPDGDVDLDDLAVIRTNFFMTDASPADGDFNGDRLVGFEDLQIWKDNRTPATSAGNVPEPCSLALLLFAAAGWTGCRRSARQDDN